MTEQTFVLADDLDTLDAIDEAVEQFKNDTLPKIEHELLRQSQQRLALQEKKRSLRANGRDTVTVRTATGRSRFAVCVSSIPTGNPSRYCPTRFRWRCETASWIGRPASRSAKLPPFCRSSAACVCLRKIRFGDSAKRK